MQSKTSSIKYATLLTVYLLIVWGFYRFLIQLPEEIEELFVKPIIWLVPTLYLLYREKLGLKDIGLRFNNLFPTIYLGLAFGTVFAVEGILVNFLKYGQLQFNANLGTEAFIFALGVSFVTAISEELTFRGYIFSRVLIVLKDEWTANILTSVAWSLIHLPIAIFVWHLQPVALLIYLLLTFLYGFGAAFIFARTNSIIGCILLHVFWQWPIILFR